MIRLLSIGIDCISSILFVVPAMIVLQYAVLRQRHFRQWIAALLFALYSIAVFSVVGLPTVGTFQMDFGLHLIPLTDIVNSPTAYIKNTVLNIILFVPLGFLVPAVWKNYRSIKSMFFMGLALSITIEILQLFTFRLTDIDDLITNTAGTVAGYYIGDRFSFKLPLKLTDEPGHLKPYEPVVILAVMLFISIFLKPTVSHGIWNLVLSSPWWEAIK